MRNRWLIYIGLICLWLSPLYATVASAAAAPGVPDIGVAQPQRAPDPVNLAAPQLLPFCPAQPVARVEPPVCPDCTGLDIAFIVDQSGSMWGAGGSDTLGLRYYAPLFAVRWLAADVLRLHQTDTYRYTVVDFGDTTRIPSGPPYDSDGWYTIAPATDEDWANSAVGVTQALSSSRVKDPMGNTRVFEAFAAAKAQFDKLATHPSIGSRRKVIILLTDGNPDPTPGGAQFYFRETLIKWTQENLPSDEYAIYVVGMPSPTQDYWPDSEDCWQQLTGARAQLVRNQSEVGHFFQDFLRELTEDFPSQGTSVLLTEPGQVPIPPYLKSATFTFFKDDPTSQLIINDPTGAVVDCSLLDPQAGLCEGTTDPIQSITVFSPQPGQWVVDTNQNLQLIDVTLLQIQIRVGSSLIRPAVPQPEYLPIPIEYALQDSLGRPLPVYSDPQYALNLQAEIRNSAGTIPLPLNTGTAAGTFAGVYETPVDTGVHTIHVIATSKDPTNAPIQVFEGDVGTFDVQPLTMRAVTMPASAQQYEPVTVGFSFFDLQSQPIINLPGGLAFTLDVVEAGGSSASVPLTNAQGVLSGEFTPQTSGPAALHFNAALTLPDGSSVVVADESYTIAVDATLLVKAEIVDPAPTTESAVTDVFFKQNPFMLTVQLKDPNGLADPARVLQGDPAQALKARVIKNGTEDVSGDLILKPVSGSAGIYQAEGHDFGVGNYSIQVLFDLPPARGYALAPPAPPITVARVRDPVHAAAVRYGPPALGLLLLGLLAVVFVDRGRRRHPVKGKLVLITNDHNRQVMWSETLDNHNLNSVRFANFKPTTNIAEMRLYSDSQTMTERKEVRVVIATLDKKKPLGDRGAILAPYGEQPVGVTFMLLKDPSAERITPISEAAPQKSRYKTDRD